MKEVSNISTAATDKKSETTDRESCGTSIPLLRREPGDCDQLTGEPLLGSFTDVALGLPAGSTTT